jgi:hypothetical protein
MSASEKPLHIDIETSRRTAADEIAEYLARHQYDLSPN